MDNSEIFNTLDNILEESLTKSPFIPIPTMISILWNSEEYRVPLICSFGKAILKMQINGKGTKEIKKHFVKKLGIEEDFFINCQSYAALTGPYCADISDGIIDFSEAKNKLELEFGENKELAEPMLIKISELIVSDPKFEFTPPSNLSGYKLKIELHRQLAEFYFSPSARKMSCLMMSIAQDLIDGKNEEDLLEELKNDFDDLGIQILDQIKEILDNPHGVWIKIIHQLKSC